MRTNPALLGFGWCGCLGFGVEFLGGDFGGGSGLALGVLVFVLQLGVDLAGLLGLAFGLIELGELELGEAWRDGRGVALDELVIEIDGLGVLAALLVERGEAGFAEGGQIGVPAGRDLLESFFRRAVLALIHVGGADEVLGQFAGAGEVVLVGDLLELGVRGGGAGLCVGEGLHAGRHGMRGVGQDGLVGLHGRSERGCGGFGADIMVFVPADASEDDDDSDDTGDDGFLAVFVCPMGAAGGEGDKLVLLLQLTLSCVIHENSVLQSYKKIAGSASRASFQFSREGKAGDKQELLADNLAFWFAPGGASISACLL
jgi:hypothetical protein